jgi:hypothetical protein
MRYGILAVAVATAFGLAAGPSYAQADAKAIIEKAITAHGGKELLDKYPASRNKFKGELSILGMDISFEGTSVQGPGQFRLDMIADIAGQKLNVVQIVDGAKVKVKQSLGGMDLPNNSGEAEMEELKFSVVGQEIAMLTPLLSKPKKYSMKVEADEEVDGKKATVVTVTAKMDEKGEKTKDVKLFFDKTSSLLVKTSRKGLVPGDMEGREAPQESFLSEYKKIDGLMVAMKTVNFIDGKKFMTLTSTEHVNLEKVDAKEFNLDD